MTTLLMCRTLGLMLMFVGNGCLAAQALPEVTLVPKADVAETFPPELRAALAIEDQFSGPAPLTIGRPHRVRLPLGTEQIVVEPGGYNSVTYVSTGMLVSGHLDKSKIRSITTDTGSELITRAHALELAVDWCAIAERGLSAQSSLNPAEIIPYNTRDLPGSSPYSQLVPVCSLENQDFAFQLSFKGGPDLSDDIDMDSPEFRIGIYYAQNLRP